VIEAIEARNIAPKYNYYKFRSIHVWLCIDSDNLAVAAMVQEQPGMTDVQSDAKN
jgi:hypothetical protein